MALLKSLSARELRDVPVVVFTRRCLLGAGLIALMAAGGCAKNPSPMDSSEWRVAGPPYQVPRHYVAPDATTRRIIEDDGIEEQAPPRLRREVETTDDPSEPFSPNYGSEPVRQGAVGLDDPVQTSAHDEADWSNYTLQTES